MIICTRVGCKHEGTFYPQVTYYAPAPYDAHGIPCIMNLPHCWEHMLKTRQDELDTPDIRKIATNMANSQGKMLPDFKKVELSFLNNDSPIIQKMLVLWAIQLH